MLANLQQQLNPETVVFELGFVFSAWGLAYFFIAYIAPIFAAYGGPRRLVSPWIRLAGSAPR